MRVWELCPKEHLSNTRRKQQYYLWKTPCCWGWRSPSADLTCYLGRFPACHAFGSKMLWQSCQGLSGLQTITPSCSSMWASMTLAGETWSVASVTISHRRWRPRAWVPRWHLLDPAREEEGLDEDWKDSVGQQIIYTVIINNKDLGFAAMGLSGDWGKDDIHFAKWSEYQVLQKPLPLFHVIRPF